MTSDKSSIRPALLIAFLVVLVTASSFGISRMLVNTSIEEAKPLADQRSAQRQQLQQAEQQQASAQARQDTLQRLLGILEEKMQQNVKDSMLLISAGNLAYDLQQYEKAEKYYRLFLDNIVANLTSVWIDYGFAVFQTGKQPDGIGILRSVLKTEPRNQTALFNLAFMYQQIGNMDSTKRLLAACRDVDPNTSIGQNAAQVYSTLTTQ